MAPDSRSPSPVGLTDDAWQETFSYYWLKVSPSPSEDIIPQEIDVLCGKDSEAYRHAGNLRFRSVISHYRNGYKNTKSKNIKTSITKEIIDLIREAGGRFLRKDEQGMWHDVGDKCAHEKVSHALRDPEKKSRRKTHLGKDWPPTPEEDNDFQRLFADQQRIFKALLEENEKSKSCEGDEQWWGISV